MDILERHLEEAERLYGALRTDGRFREAFQAAATRLTATLRAGGSILIAGNGGSAGEAQHFSAELVGRYKKERRGLPAIALTTDTSALTAIGNDYSFEQMFARQIEALGRKGDVFVALSTSGNSPNIIRAIERAKELGITTIGLGGKGGGSMREKADLVLTVPSDDTARIQEVHLMVIHALCEHVEGGI